MVSVLTVDRVLGSSGTIDDVLGNEGIEICSFHTARSEPHVSKFQKYRALAPRGVYG